MMTNIKTRRPKALYLRRLPKKTFGKKTTSFASTENLNSDEASDYLPNIIAVSAVVPEDRDVSRVQDLAKAASVSINDLVTTFSSSKGKSESSTMTLGKWSRTNCAAPFPP